MPKFEITLGGRSINRYNSWLNELTGILKNVKGSMIIASYSESNSKKILSDLKDRFRIVIMNAEIQKSGIFIPKDATIIFENGNSSFIPEENLNSARKANIWADLPVTNNQKWFDEMKNSHLNFRGYYNGEFIFTKPNKQD